MNEIRWPAATSEDGLDMLSSSNSSRRHGGVTQLLHWATVLLVGIAYVLSPGGSESRVYSTASDGLRDWHESFRHRGPLGTLHAIACHSADCDRRRLAGSAPADHSRYRRCPAAARAGA